MNHKARAKTIVSRSMPLPLRRQLAGWVPNIEKEVARGLRQVELAAHHHAVRAAANYVGDCSPADATKKIVFDMLKLLDRAPKAQR